MRASNVEFRYRFWVIGVLFWAAFNAYSLDPVNAAVALIQWGAGPAFALNTLHDRHVLQAVFLVVALLVAAAAWIRTWGAAYLRSEVVQDSNLRSERLVADGPYRYVRNPLYFGNVILAVGMGLFASRLGWLILVVGMILFVYRLIGREEAALIETQGEAYRQFLSAVPQLWPALRPRVPSGGLGPRWKQAWVGESFMWGLELATFSYAITLQQRVFLWVIALSLAAYGVMQIYRKSRKGRST